MKKILFFLIPLSATGCLTVQATEKQITVNFLFNDSKTTFENMPTSTTIAAIKSEIEKPESNNEFPKIDYSLRTDKKTDSLLPGTEIKEAVSRDDEELNLMVRIHSLGKKKDQIPMSKTKNFKKLLGMK